MKVSLVVCETDRLNAESARATSNWQRNRVAVVNLGDLRFGDGQVLGGGHAIIGGKGVAAAKVVIDGLATDGCDGEPVHRSLVGETLLRMNRRGGALEFSLSDRDECSRFGERT